MNKKDFIAQVEMKCPQELLPFVDSGIDIAGELLSAHGQYYEWAVTQAIQYIGRLAPSIKNAEGDLSRFKITPEVSLVGDYLAHLLRRWVKEIRKSYFNSEQAPFKTYEDALKWMEGQSKELTVQELEIKSHMELIPLYRTDEGKIAYINPKPDASELWCVLPESNKMKRKTGLGMMSLIMYILADIKPILPSYEWWAVRIGQEIETEEGVVNFMNTELTVKIRRQIGWDEWRDLYNEVREYFAVRKGKMLNEKHLELYRMVQERGGPIEGEGTVKFWECVRDDWNNTHPDNEYRTWKGVKKAYKSIIDKLERRMTTKGGTQ